MLTLFFSNSVYGRERWLKKKQTRNSLHQYLSGTILQWSRSCLHVQMKLVRLPAKLFSISLLYNILFCEGGIFRWFVEPDVGTIFTQNMQMVCKQCNLRPRLKQVAVCLCQIIRTNVITRLKFTNIMHNYQLNMRSCHGPDCDYGKQTLTLSIQNFSSWTDFPQYSIEMGWEMGNIFGMYINLVFVFQYLSCAWAKSKTFFGKS